MFNPRTSNELWNDSELEAPLHFPNATRRRAFIAHSVGVLGVLGTLALGVTAIGPHLSSVAHRAHGLFAVERPAQATARPVAQSAPLAATPSPPLPAPTTPELAVTPPPAEQPRPDTAATTPVPAEPVATTLAPAADPVAATPTPAEPVAMSPAPVATTPAPAEPVAAQPPAAKALAVATSSDAPARSVASARHARTEPRLTWAEIERRKARYEAWLKGQGLEPVQ